MILPNGERINMFSDLLPPDMYDQDELSAFLAPESRWDRMRMESILDMTGMNPEQLEETMSRQLETRRRVLNPVLSQLTTDPS
ncbi:MAG: hypothetical protein AAGH99_08690 [Planctomycetota bacterium]